MTSKITVSFVLVAGMAHLSCATLAPDAAPSADQVASSASPPVSEPPTPAAAPSVTPEPTPAPPEPTADELERKALTEAVAAGSGMKIRDLCLEQHNGRACEFIKWGCEKQGKGDYCSVMALAVKDQGEGGQSKFRAYLHLACRYKYEEACAAQRQIAEEDRRQAALDRVHDKATCAMTPVAVRMALGSPDATISCTDNIHEALRYGRRWVFFRSEGAFLIMDHENYHGACLENPLMYPDGYKGWFICQGR